MPWPKDWRFCHKLGCRLQKALPQQRDASCAYLWLATELRHDPSALFAVRQILADESPAWDVCRLSDDDVIDEVAKLLRSGRLHIHTKAIRTIPSRTGGGAAVTGAPEKLPAALPLSQRERPAAPAAGSRQQFADPPTFASGTNFSAQAATLVAAAAAGTPFCPP